MKRTVYRVRKGFPGAGQFAKASSWRRSKAHGGTRYVRQRIEVKPALPEVVEFPEPMVPEVEEFEPEEWEASADYEEPE